jgi:cytochrome b561
MLPTAEHYATVSIWLHWIIAIAVLGNIAGAILSEGLPGPTRGMVMGIHKSVGLTVLMLSLVRLAWRLGHGTPPLKPTLTALERSAARLVHTLFYVLMILVPLLGWTMSSAGDRPLSWFGLPFPKLPIAPDSPIAGLAHDGHVLLGLSFLGLVVLHVGGALKHQFIDRDNELARMLPFLRR